MEERWLDEELAGCRLGRFECAEDRDEDLQVRLAAPAAKGDRLAGEVRHPVQPRLIVEVHLRRDTAAVLTAEE